MGCHAASASSSLPGFHGSRPSVIWPCTVDLSSFLAEFSKCHSYFYPVPLLLLLPYPHAMANSSLPVWMVHPLPPHPGSLPRSHWPPFFPSLNSFSPALGHLLSDCFSHLGLTSTALLWTPRGLATWPYICVSPSSGPQTKSRPLQSPFHWASFLVSFTQL